MFPFPSRVRVFLASLILAIGAQASPAARTELGGKLVRQCHLHQPRQLRGSDAWLRHRRRDVRSGRRP